MIRAAAKNHADVAVVVDPSDYAACWRSCADTAARRRSRCGASSLPRLMPAPLLTTPRSPIGSPSSSATRRPALPRGRRAACSSRCATAKIRISRRRSIARASRGPASLPRGKCRAKSSPTTTSTTPMPPTNASPSSIRDAQRPASSSNTPIPAALPRAQACSMPIARRCACDPVSAFGGIVAVNRTLDAEAARAITEIFTEVIIAPDASEEADRHCRREEESSLAASPAACPTRAPAA